MSSGQFLRTAQNGVNIYLRLESNTFRRLPIAENQAAILGERVAEEYEKDAAKNPAIGEATKRIMVENPFHPSSKDPIVHATVSYEKQDGSFVRDEPKHVAKKATEQALVSSVPNLRARLLLTTTQE